MNLEKLLPYQLQSLIDLAQSLLNVKLAKTKTHHEIIELENKVHCCPHCSNKNIIKHGHRRGIQRYLCKDCSKTFGATNNSFLFSTQIGYETWIHFMACELLHLSLRATSNEIGVSTTACFHMRHKYYGALESVKKN